MRNKEQSEAPKRRWKDKRRARGGRDSEGDGEEDLGTVCLATAGRRGPRGMLMRERPFSGLPSGRGWSWSRVFSRIPDLIEEELGAGGRGSLRGQGSELSRDPTTTNAGLIFGLSLHRACKNDRRTDAVGGGLVHTGPCANVSAEEIYKAPAKYCLTFSWLQSVKCPDDLMRFSE